MIGIGIALAALAALLLAVQLTLAVPATRGVVVPAAVQPVVGRSAVVTGLVFDGTRYTSAPIAVAAPYAGRGYTVTALVSDGTTYRTAPVQVGGR
jgi:hypothetical protein